MPTLITSSLILCLVLTVSTREIKNNSTRVDCVDNGQDTGSWDVAGPRWSYVANSSSLPGILRDKFEGYGIFYREGPSAFSFITDLGLWFEKPQYASNYMYVKYYLHLHTQSEAKAIHAFPALYPDEDLVDRHDKRLPQTQSFVWGEAVLELNQTQFDDYYAGVGVWGYDADEYFLVEKIIVAQGFLNFSSTNPTRNEMKALCGWEGEEESTTLQPTTASSQICSSIGNFPDPEDCQKFHMCTANGHGGFDDNVLTCPDWTVWCQEKLRCESPDICPCQI